MDALKRSPEPDHNLGEVENHLFKHRHRRFARYSTWAASFLWALATLNGGIVLPPDVVLGLAVLGAIIGLVALLKDEEEEP